MNNDFIDEIRCPACPLISFNVPYTVEAAGKSLVTDPRALHMLKQGLLLKIGMDNGKLRLISDPDNSAWLHQEQVFMPIFGPRAGHLVWISPQALRQFGQEKILKDLPALMEVMYG